MSDSDRVSMHFRRLCSGLDMSDLAFLSMYSKLPAVVYHFDIDRAAVVPATDLPWPVYFSLVRFNNKHVFASRLKPLHAFPVPKFTC